MSKRSASIIEHKFEGMGRFVKATKEMGASHGVYRIFEDFLALSSISVANAVLPNKERENQYLSIAKQYTKDEMNTFAEMFADLINTMERESQDAPVDVLGPIFHELELHNHYHGQFFTPQHICDFMALIALDGTTKSVQAEVERKGYIEVYEPACGSGATITGCAKALKQTGFNYCSQMVVTATDIDIKCVHMAYLQLSLYGIPAVVVHGNTLTVEEWSRWYTPIYVINGWDHRRKIALNAPALTIKAAKQPQNGMFYFNFDTAERGTA